jgi:hypothetical protein
VSVPSCKLAPTALLVGGGQHSLAGKGAGVPIRTTGEKAWHSVYSVVSWSQVIIKECEGGNFDPITFSHLHYEITIYVW